jgi:hypothetical protein
MLIDSCDAKPTDGFPREQSYTTILTRLLY